jgi:glycosyltransferase involved in cell wall biosynthesis
MYGGIERMLVTLARERASCAEMEPHFGLCFEGQLSEELRDAGVPVHMLGNVRFSRPWTVWLARSSLARLLRRERYDAVICHACWPHALFAGTVRSAGIGLVFWAHGVPNPTHWLDRRAGRFPPDLAIANSRFTEAGLLKLFPAVHSDVIYCPVSVPQLADGQERREVRQQLGVSPDTAVIFMASRVEPCKGHEVLLGALARMRALASWECWIAGDACAAQEKTLLLELKRAAERDLGDRVKFLGHRLDVQRLMSGADVYCQPNTGPDSFGISFIEALFEGLPVVTTDIGGGAEIVNRDCGLLVPAGDTEALAAALTCLMSDPSIRAASASAARRRAHDLCNAPARIRDLYDVLSGATMSKAAA